jgi:hypothetical protein
LPYQAQNLLETPNKFPVYQAPDNYNLDNCSWH